MSMYDVLLAVTKLEPPSKKEGEQVFLRRLTKALDEDIEEDDFDNLAEAVQLWVNDAIVAVKHGNPVAKLEGSPFSDDDETEDEDEKPAVKASAKAPKGSDKKGADTKAEAPKAADKPAAKGGAKGKAQEPATEAAKGVKGGKGAGKGKAAAAPARAAPDATAKKNAEKAEAAKAKREAEKARSAAAKTTASQKQKTRVLSSNDSAGGVLDLLLEEMFKDPNTTPKQLKERVEGTHKGVIVKDGNAVGIRQQYRRVVRFLQRKGKLDEIKLN